MCTQTLNGQVCKPLTCEVSNLTSFEGMTALQNLACPLTCCILGGVKLQFVQLSMFEDFCIQGFSLRDDVSKDAYTAAQL